LKTIENKYLNCEELYVSSLSNETIIYKGLMMPEGLKNFYLDIKNKRFYSLNLSLPSEILYKYSTKVASSPTF
jgi:glutamate synthase domain-containing protein 1